MQKLLVFSWFLLSSITYASPWSESMHAQISDKVAKHFKNQTAVGLVVGVINGDEAHVWSYGERIKGQGELPTGGTFFEMGSITKTYTATLLAMEVLSGKVNLEDRVKKFWPELEGMEAGEVTLLSLATHHSGLPRIPDNFEPQDPLNPYADYDETRLLDFLKKVKLPEEKPYGYEYSNLGVGLLGYLLSEKLNGLSYRDYLSQQFLGPMGLGDTRVALQGLDLSRSAQGYSDFFELIPFWDLNVLEGAGVLKTTVNDMLKYARLQMSNDDSIFSRAARMTHERRDGTDSEDTNIGLIWDLTRLGEHSVILHGGATGGYRANLILDPEKKVGGMILSNVAVSPSCVLAPVFDVSCELPEWVSVGSTVLEQYVGSYRNEEIQLDLGITLKSGFLGLVQDGEKVRLFARSQTLFEFPRAGAKFTFEPKPDGSVDHFVLNQHGQDFVFERKSVEGKKLTHP